MPLLWGEKSKMYINLWVLSAFFLRKYFDFLNICFFIANFVNRNKSITRETKNEVY